MIMKRNSSVKKCSGKLFHEEQFIPSEEDECKAFYDYTQLIPAIKEYVVHFANEGKRTNGRRLKRIGGLPKGFPDYCIFIPSRGFHSLFIEMKTIDERLKKQKEEQIKWIERLLKAGHYATFAFGAEHAIQVLINYLDHKILIT